jgi:hypothetical protein
MTFIIFIVSFIRNTKFMILNLLEKVLYEILYKVIFFVNMIQGSIIIHKINFYIDTYIHNVSIEPFGDWVSISWFEPSSNSTIYNEVVHSTETISVAPIISKNTSTLIVLKFDKDYITRVLEYEQEHLNIIENLIELKIIASNVRFINIEYTYPRIKNVVQITLPIHYFISGNEILSSTFICRYIKYNYGKKCKFDDNYTLLVIDDNIKSFTLNKNQYVSLTNENYIIKNLESDISIVSVPVLIQPIWKY